MSVKAKWGKFSAEGIVGQDNLMMTLEQKDTIRYNLGSGIFWYKTKRVSLENV
jgi:hypothetical protein